MMKKILSTSCILVLLSMTPSITFSQDLEIAGEVKIGTMGSDNTADSIVVRQADGTLALRDVSTILEFQVVNQSNDTLHLSNGDFIELISGFDGQYSSLTGSPTTLSSFTNDPGFLTSEADAGWTMVDDTTYIMKYVGIGTDSPNGQLDVQGNASTDTVAKITVNYSGTSNVVGLRVLSTPDGASSQRGTGGIFIGGFTGIEGKSENGDAVYGESTRWHWLGGRDNNRAWCVSIEHKWGRYIRVKRK